MPSGAEASIPRLSAEAQDRMKIWGAPWKCRAVDNEENQKQVSLPLPTALGIAAAITTFPPRHDDSLSRAETETNNRAEQLRKVSSSTATHLPPFMPILRLENAPPRCTLANRLGARQ